MDFGNKVLFFLSGLGAFNGLILSIYFFFFSAKKHLSNYLFAALLLVLSIRIGKSVAYFFDYGLPKIYLQLGLTACFFIGPFLYFFIKSEISLVRKMPKSWIGQTTSWLLIILTVGIMYPYQVFPSLWRTLFIPLIYLQWGLYIAFSFFLLIPLLKKWRRKEKLKPFEIWVLTICTAVLILFVSYVWSIFNITKGSYINAAVFFSLIIYLVVFVLLYRRKANDLSSFSAQKYADKKLNDNEAQVIIDNLKKVITEKELFKNPGLKINDLAKEIKISAHQLSQILNDKVERNFTLFINEYRIDEACKLLLAENNPKIEAIGFEVGFNSRSTFFSTFKKLKGTTPALYQQQNAASSVSQNILT
jgi:AraC-like DNA-binding protein